MKTRHIPTWIRKMPPGWLRSYLIAAFLPDNRTQRREQALW